MGNPCDTCSTNRDITTAERLTTIEVEVRGIREDIKEGILTQVKDHGKRIGVLERRGVYQAGWMAGAGCIGGGVVWLVTRVL